MNLSLYLLLGLLLSLPLAYRAYKIWQFLLFFYWVVIFLWSLKLIDPFTYNPVYWSSLLKISFSYHIDGLARLFSMLISGIGILIFIYASIYTQNFHRKKAKILAILQIFAISMLCIVLTDNTIILFLGWEITTITSYLLIQFDVTDKKANQAAFNSMFISVTGGLPMLAGFILLQQQTNSWSIQTTLYTLQYSPHLLPAFWLLILGAVTKSAQFPFYFWLPGAMKAPAPVSAYLHSATMVNAGIYLLSRFHPLFGSLSVWYPTLAFFGVSTMLIGGILSLFQRDLKAILAYTTLYALGSMVYLLASKQWAAAEVLVIFLLFHGLYKAAAFIWVGTIDKTYGCRDIIELRGLGKQWFTGSIVAIISLSSMAGLPPFFGFVIKQMMYEAKLAAHSISYGLMTLSMLSSMLITAVSLKCLYYWFTGQPQFKKRQPLQFGLVCALVLVGILLFSELFKPFLVKLLSSAADSITWQTKNFESIYTTLSTLLSIITICGGLILFLISQWINQYSIHWPTCLNPLIIFEKTLENFLHFGRWFTFITQRQAINKQLMIILMALLLWLVTAFYISWQYTPLIHWQATKWPVTLLSLLLIITGTSLLVSNQFLNNIVSLTILGLIISGIFVIQGAPDVAMTQLLIEILTIIILVIALSKSKFMTKKTTTTQKIIHAGIALLIGSSITIMLLMVVNMPFNSTLNEYFIKNSLILAHGRNVVNVILVDFRAFDTLGEALVILATALAIWLLIEKKPAINKTIEGDK